MLGVEAPIKGADTQVSYRVQWRAHRRLAGQRGGGIVVWRAKRRKPRLCHGPWPMKLLAKGGEEAPRRPAAGGDAQVGGLVCGSEASAVRGGATYNDGSPATANVPSKFWTVNRAPAPSSGDTLRGSGRTTPPVSNADGAPAQATHPAFIIFQIVLRRCSSSSGGSSFGSADHGGRRRVPLLIPAMIIKRFTIPRFPSQLFIAVADGE